MTTPTLKNLAELAGMTEEQLDNLHSYLNTAFFTAAVSSRDALALALIAARKDEAEKCAKLAAGKKRTGHGKKGIHNLAISSVELALFEWSKQLSAALKEGGGE